MAYILVSTDNFIYTMLFHFINNLFAQLASLGAGSETMDMAGDLLTPETIPALIGTYLLMGFMVPFLMLGGTLLLKGMEQIKEEGTTKLVISISIAAVISLICIVAGVYLVINNYEALLIIRE